MWPDFSTDLDVLGGREHLIQTLECFLCQVDAGVPHMCLGELRDVFELSQDLRLGAIPRHSIHGRHHRLLDHLGLDAEAEKTQAMF